MFQHASAPLIKYVVDLVLTRFRRRARHQVFFRHTTVNPPGLSPSFRSWQRSSVKRGRMSRWYHASRGVVVDPLTFILTESTSGVRPEESQREVIKRNICELSRHDPWSCRVFVILSVEKLGWDDDLICRLSGPPASLHHTERVSLIKLVTRLWLRRTSPSRTVLLMSDARYTHPSQCLRSTPCASIRYWSQCPPILGSPREDLIASLLFVASRVFCCSMHVVAADMAADLTILDCLHGHCHCDFSLWDTCYCDIYSSLSFSNEVSDLKRHLCVRDENNSSCSSSSLPHNYCAIRTRRSSSSWRTFSLTSRSKRSTGVSWDSKERHWRYCTPCLLQGSSSNILRGKDLKRSLKKILETIDNKLVRNVQMKLEARWIFDIFLDRRDVVPITNVAITRAACRTSQDRVKSFSFSVSPFDWWEYLNWTRISVLWKLRLFISQTSSWDDDPMSVFEMASTTLHKSRHERTQSRPHSHSALWEKSVSEQVQLLCVPQWGNDGL